mmetsp:Transcript_836/g.1878  ORF Transcript_836/g.1878 Transcript_836/m.1878 type:complete len:225 (+) Transcript_836:111-785(+)
MVQLVLDLRGVLSNICLHLTKCSHDLPRLVGSGRLSRWSVPRTLSKPVLARLSPLLLSLFDSFACRRPSLPRFGRGRVQIIRREDLVQSGRVSENVVERSCSCSLFCFRDLTSRGRRGGRRGIERVICLCRFELIHHYLTAMSQLHFRCATFARLLSCSLHLSLQTRTQLLEVLGDVDFASFHSLYQTLQRRRRLVVSCKEKLTPRGRRLLERERLLDGVNFVF